MKRPYKALPPVEVLRDLLRYDSDTGQLYWRGPRSGGSTAKPAGHVPGSGRQMITINYELYHAPRIVWAMVTGKDPGQHSIDHIDRDPLNNLFANLRLATPGQQLQNQATRNRHGLKGVSYNGSRSKPWRASVTSQGVRHFLGYYATAEEAHAAYQRAASRLFGEFACFDSK